jgi:pyridoxine 5-phosphate synthase
VNIDHVATLRQARGTSYPSVLEAAQLAERSGADSITVHLREDRRHIQDADVEALCAQTQTRVNLEMAVTAEMIEIALQLRPADVCLVPEKREELTTEGGLDVSANLRAVADVVKRLDGAGIRVSLFIDPDPIQLRAAAEVGAPVIELHTGTFADAEGEAHRQELSRLYDSCVLANELGLKVNAGHGLHLGNVQAVTRLPHMTELNIGHSIVSRAVFVGLGRAVREMKDAMEAA